MQEDELRIWLAGRLNRREVPPSVWHALSLSGHVSEATEDDAARSRLVEVAKSLLPYEEVIEGIAEVPKGTESQAPEQDPPSLSEYEWNRAQALKQYVMLSAAIHPEVQFFYSSAESPLDFEEYEVLRSRMEDSPENWYEQLKKDPNPPTLLINLQRVAERLERDFSYYWSDKEAAEFVLGQDVEPRSPVKVDVKESAGAHLDYRTITLKVEPWVPTDTVAKFYQYHQLRVLGRRSRAISPQNLGLVSFTLEQIREMAANVLHELRRGGDIAGLAKAFSWRTLMERWNEFSPQARYESERRFHTDFYRTSRSMIAPFTPKKEPSERQEEARSDQQEG